VTWKHERILNCLSINVNCCINYGYMMLNNQVESNNGIFDVYLNKYNLGCD